MELIGTVDKQEYQLKIDKKGEHLFEIDIEGRTYAIDFVETMPHVYSLLHGHQSYEARVHRDAKQGRFHAHFYADSYTVELADPMQLLLEQAVGSASKGVATLEAPMPGKVLRILVKEGDEVVEDQDLLVLVAMKMENALASPKAGRISKILTQEDANVEGGCPLIIVE